MFLLDSNVYIRGFRDAAFSRQVENFHAAELPQLALSAVVLAELLVGAQTPQALRSLRRTLLEPFRARRRLLAPAWPTWERAAQIDRGLRRDIANGTKLVQRSFFHDILVAASAREVGATIIT